MVLRFWGEHRALIGHIWKCASSREDYKDIAVRDEQKRTNELNQFIEQQDSEITEFDESLARRWLKEIVVWNDRFSVELKSGVTVEIMV